ncbi:MAG: HD domain-containing protein [bacterium]|nr:HD domain-containing protein [bacterium]
MFRKSKTKWFYINFTLLGLIGYLDYLTGQEIWLLPLYFIPIGLAAWFLNLWAGVAISILSTIIWLTAEYSYGTVYRQKILVLNAGIWLVLFLGIAYLFTKLKETRIKLLQVLSERTEQLTEEISDHKKTQVELQFAEQKYRNLVETALTGIFQTELDGTFIYANPALAKIFEFNSAQELIGTSVRDRYKNPNDRIRLLAELQKNRSVTDFEHEVLTKTGKTKTLLVSATLIDHIISGMVLDITERKQAEEKIKRHIKQLTALRNIDLAITASLDLRLTLEVVLDQVTSQLGVDASSILLLNPYSQTLNFIVARGFNQPQVLQRTKLRIGEGYAGRAAFERKIINIENLQETPGEFAQATKFQDEKFISYYAVPLIAKGKVNGVLELFHREPLNPEQDWLNFLEMLASQAAIAIDNAKLFDDLQKSNIELVVAYDATIEGWSKAMDLRDKETEGHTLRVTEITERLARKIGVPDSEIVHIRRGALLHDIGKLGVPDAILHKPDKLNDEEWAIMKKHPVYAYEWLYPIVYLRPALDIPYCHHEKWNGTGYPRGLKGESIPLAARIFAIIDVWDALRSDRPYRPALPEEIVIAYLNEQAGIHFDPNIVPKFIELLREQVE